MGTKTIAVRLPTAAPTPAAVQRGSMSGAGSRSRCYATRGHGLGAGAYRRELPVGWPCSTRITTHWLTVGALRGPGVTWRPTASVMHALEGSGKGDRSVPGAVDAQP